MSYVGSGCGDYIQETSYKYIGCGAGEFEVVATRKPANISCLIVGGGVGLVALVLVVVVLLMRGPTTTTTVSTTILPPFTCNTRETWSIAKKAWCCANTQQPPGMCGGTPPTTTTPKYNCNTYEVWSPAKKVWCCANTQQAPGKCGGTPPTTPAQYNCNTREVWSPVKKSWCCANTQQPPGTCGPLPPTPQPPRLPNECLIWGDPHISTFDKSHADFYGEGIKWLVKSSEISIQAKYQATPFTNGLAATHTIAIGGSFLQGHVLKVGPMENGQITWDNAAICTGFPSSFDAAGLGSISYNGEGNLVDEAQSHLERHIVHINLPNELHVQVMRWSNHVNVRISMPPAVGGQDGHCGNFNGNSADDSTEQIRARVGIAVPQGESLFKVYVPVKPGKHITLNECPPEKRLAAQAGCRKARPDLPVDSQEIRDCEFDVCFGGDQYAEQDLAY